MSCFFPVGTELELELQSLLRRSTVKSSAPGAEVPVTADAIVLNIAPWSPEVYVYKSMFLLA